MYKHLLLGALTPPTGGTTVLFSQLIKELKNQNDITIKVIDISSQPPRKLRKLMVAITTTLQLIIILRKYDSVALHASIDGALYYSPVVYIIAKLFKKPFILRTFGGNFDYFYENSGKIKKWSFKKFCLGAKLALFETRKSVEFFRQLSTESVDWYPNSRPYAPLPNHSRSTNNKFIFLGHITADKGVKILVEAVKKSNTDIHLDIAGPLKGDIAESELLDEKINYLGVIPATDIHQILPDYLALVLPTFYIGEGYPGVILEAFSAGIPVITTEWRAIPEIVDKSCGILIPARNVTSLRAAMEYMLTHPDQRKTMQIGAQQRAQFFASYKWSIFYSKRIREETWP